MQKQEMVLIFVPAFVLCVLSGCGNQKGLSSAEYGQTVSYEAQSIDLPGVPNARQLGGYVINGKTVRKDVLLRTGELGNASRQAVNTLAEKYHLAYIFDLRASVERDHLPDRDVEGSRNIWLPCLEDMLRELSAKGSKMKLPSIDDPYLLDSILKEFSENTWLVELSNGMMPAIAADRTIQKNVAEILDSLVVLPEGKAALWHCSRGKDRCGFTSAMVLAALGADQDLIVKDFALSNHGYQQKLDSILEVAEKRGCSEDNRNMIYNVIGVNPGIFSKMLDQIKKQYGSLDNYLTKALDCPASQRRALREKFLVK